MHTFRGNVKPFVLHPDARGNSLIIAPWPARALAELFTSDFAPILRRASTAHPNHRFHPLFQIFLEADDEYWKNKTTAVKTNIEITCNNYFSTFSKPTKISSHIKIEALTTLNTLSKNILDRARDMSEEIKQFRRAAQDTRTSAMQYAHHLITRAPNPFFVHLTLHRSPLVAEYDPTTYLEIRAIREQFKRALNKEILDPNYLGYSILLRHNADIGYWLDAFVYLIDSLGLAPSIVDEMTQKWNALIGAKRAEINCVAWPVPPGNEERVAQTLRAMTIATEPDFYCRTIPPNADRAFWCSQSPVGKLAKRTRYRKRSAANASKRKRESRNELVKELTSEDTRQLFEQAFAAWDQAKEKKAKKTAERRSKATETRQRKRKLGKSAP
ncbi:MAG: hypothetical protein V4796_33030 [Burkholderia cenocepacia]